MKVFPGLAILVAALFGPEAIAGPVTLPNDFIVENLQGKTCARYYAPSRLDADMRVVAGIASVNLSTARTSVTKNDDLQERWVRLLADAYGAAARQDREGAGKILATISSLAATNAMAGAPTYSYVKNHPCWSNGNRNAPCPRHDFEDASTTVIAMIISADLLEEFVTPDQREILDAYFAKNYSHFIKPLASDSLQSPGLYDFSGDGLGVLAYARWTHNSDMAQNELKRRKAFLIKVISPDGYIDNNSYRGYRNYWYHTMGTEVALGYALVARSYGQDFFADPKLGPRLRAVAERSVAGGLDPTLFPSLPARGDNAYRDPADTITGVHQMSVSLPLMMKQEYGMTLPLDARYKQLSQSETIDRFIGFRADCYYSSQG